MPFSRWTVSPALKCPGAVLMAGSQGIGLGTWRGTCVSSVFSLDSGDHISAFLLLAFHPVLPGWASALRGGAGPLPGLNRSKNREGKAPPPKPSLAGWNWREPAGPGSPVPLTQASLAGRRHSDQKESALLLAFGDITVLGGGCPWTTSPPDPPSTLGEAPKPPWASGLVLVFSLLLWSHEACELGQLKRTPANLRAAGCPGDGTVVSIRPDPGATRAWGSPSRRP